MSTDRPMTPGVRATVQRHVTEEETVAFEGLYESNEAACEAVTAQLALCRFHMAEYNEQVILLHRKKSDELDAAIIEKGAELKRVEGQLADARERLGKTTRRLGSELTHGINSQSSPASS